MSAIEIRQLDIPIAGLPRSAEGFRLAHLSDLHLRKWGRHEERLHNVLRRLKCDSLLVTGDFGHEPSAYEQTGDLVRRMFAPLRFPLGMYGVLGNHDDGPLADQDLPLTILRNELRLINVGRFEYYLGGVEQTVTKRSTIAEAINQLPHDAPVILMAHYPSTFFELESGSGVVMLSGHTHGGQIRLPGVGCLWTNDSVPRSMARGLHLAHGNWLHISSGTGSSGPLPVRLFCPPEVTVLRLRRATGIKRRRKHAPTEQQCVAA